MTKTEWKVYWFDEDQGLIGFIEQDENGKVPHSFILSPPSHAKLYYALKDWFND